MQGGMGVPRCIVIAIVPLVLGIIYLIKKKKLKQKIDANEAALINMMIINSALYLMGMYMQYWARLAFYTSFAPIVIMPKFVDSCFVKRERNLVRFLAMLAYFFFFAYNVYVNIGYGAMDQFYIEWF